MQILPSVAPCDDIIRENGLKLELRSDLLSATVRNKTTDNEIKPFLLGLFSITSSRVQHNTCPVKSATKYQGINEEAGRIQHYCS